jgi:phytanoyl-CoA hydroxylase
MDMKVNAIDIPYVDAQQQDCITEEQAQFFRDNGFLVLRNVIVGEELKQAQADMMNLTELGQARVENNSDYMYGKGRKTGGHVLKRIEYVIDKKDSMKSLLGNPFILRSVEKIQGNNFIPTWDSMVLKMPDEGIIVPWHRDAAVPDGAILAKPIFNVDFYMDTADLKSCLWVIPGSNKWESEAVQERIRRDADFDTSDAIPVPLNAGDAIFHDITVLHGSPAGDGNALRRTVYFEFRECETEYHYGPHVQEYIPIKQQILLACMERRRNDPAFSHETPFEYRPSGQFEVTSVQAPETYRIPHKEYWRSKS